MSGEWIDFNKKLSRNAIEKEIPISGTFELTGRCNFNCQMCYVCHSPTDKGALAAELSAGQWIDIGQQARDAGLFFLTLTGGEIFIREDFKEIYEEFTNMGFNLTIFSNASMITPEKAKWIGKRPPTKISVTLYGASPETYQKVTGHRDGYERSLRGIELLREEGINVEIKTTVIKDNYRDFEQLFNLAQNFGVGLGIVNYISPTRADCGNSPLESRLSPQMITKYEKEVENRMISIKNELTEDAERMNQEIRKKELEKEKSRKSNENASDFAFKCQAGKCGFWVNWRGKITPCGLMDIPSENILEQGFAAAWNNLKVKCAQVPVCKECIQCSVREFCMTCPARLMSETGSFEKTAPYLCESAKYRSILNSRFI